MARPEGLPKVVMLTNDQNRLFPFPMKNRDADRSRNPKVPGSDRSHPPKGYNRNLRDAAGGSEAKNTEGDATRSLPKVHAEGRQSVMKHVLWVGVYKLNCLT